MAHTVLHRTPVTEEGVKLPTDHHNRAQRFVRAVDINRIAENSLSVTGLSPGCHRFFTGLSPGCHRVVTSMEQSLPQEHNAAIKSIPRHCYKYVSMYSPMGGALTTGE